MSASALPCTSESPLSLLQRIKNLEAVVLQHGRQLVLTRQLAQAQNLEIKRLQETLRLLLEVSQEPKGVADGTRFIERKYRHPM